LFAGFTSSDLAIGDLAAVWFIKSKKFGAYSPGILPSSILVPLIPGDADCEAFNATRRK